MQTIFYHCKFLSIIVQKLQTQSISGWNDPTKLVKSKEEVDLLVSPSSTSILATTLVLEGFLIILT